MFIDRQEELRFLNQRLTDAHPGPAQLLLVYGRRRVGKTALLNYWAQQSTLPYTYWVANKEPAAMQRRSFLAQLLNIPEEDAPSFDSWPSLWRWLAPRFTEENQQKILILDELSYASEADEAILSALQHAWDHHLKQSQLVIALCGSQVRTMEAIMQYQSPLFGRFTGQWHLKPLPFYALREFFPDWSLEERVALYSIIGGIPAYLEWLRPHQNLSQNIRDVMLSPGSMFMAEPMFLLYDELRELGNYQAILKAISNGHHTLSEISNAALIGRTNLTFFLKQLQDLRLIERRLPATLTTAQQRKSKRGRYHLSDPFFRFYYRFLVPHQNTLMQPETTLQHIQNELRSFVGIGFEALAQEWLVMQARKNQLPFIPEQVGSHWSRQVQIDVVAINHQTRQILIGECKWGTDPVSRSIARELVEHKAQKLRQALKDGDSWSFHYALFARAGFTESTHQYMNEQAGLLIDLEQLETGLMFE